MTRPWTLPPNAVRFYDDGPRDWVCYLPDTREIAWVDETGPYLFLPAVEAIEPVAEALSAMLAGSAQ